MWHEPGPGPFSGRLAEASRPAEKGGWPERSDSIRPAGREISRSAGGRKRGLDPASRGSVHPRHKKPAGEAGSVERKRTHHAAMRACSFFMAAFSIWRMRSAETPYSSASSWSVDFFSLSQRRRRTSLLRSSSSAMAS